MKKIGLILLLGILLGGCASGGFNRYKNQDLTSYVAENFPGGATQIVASDLADIVAGAYPPGQTSLYLTGKPEDGLTPILEAKLREKGFSLVPKPGGQAKNLSYTFDNLDDEGWYLKASLSDGFGFTSFTRAYEFNKQGFTPAGGLAQTSHSGK